MSDWGFRHTSLIVKASCSYSHIPYSLRPTLSTRALQRLSIRTQTALTMELPSDDSSWAELISRTTYLLPGEYPSFESPNPSSIAFAQLFDHTLLKTDATGPQVDELCKEARQHHFKVLYAAPSPLLTRLITPPQTVCVRLEWVARAAANLKDSDVLVCCTVGFPEGTHATAAKVQYVVCAHWR